MRHWRAGARACVGADGCERCSAGDGGGAPAATASGAPRVCGGGTKDSLAISLPLHADQQTPIQGEFGAGDALYSRSRGFSVGPLALNIVFDPIPNSS